MKVVLLLASASIHIAVSGSACAQTTTVPDMLQGTAEARFGGSSDGIGVQDIVVTAQRRSERLQDVPISVNVIGGDSLGARGVSDTKQLMVAVPSLDIGMVGPAGTPYLRGVGSSASNPNDEPSVALYVDGVYFAAPAVNIQGFNNIERIEVLKGPQGTLFGRNATGGVIQIITRDPKQDPELDASIGYGNYDTITGSLYATGGLTETLAADIAFQIDDQRKGWGRNLVLGGDANKQKTWAVRSKLMFTPNDLTSIKLSGDYNERRGIAVEYRLPPGVLGVNGLPTPGGKYDSTANIALDNYGKGQVRSDSGGVALNVSHDAGFAEIVSISAFRKNTGCLCVDTDGVAEHYTEAFFPLFQRSLTQELQMVSPKGETIDWLVGIFLYDNKASYDDAQITGIDFGNAVIGINGAQRTKSGSVYGQGTANIAPSTKVTGGLRYTRERQKFMSSIDVGSGFVAAPDRKQGYNKFSWRLALDQEFSRDVHAYISYNRGLKSGGFDLLSTGTFGYLPEELDAYEAGIKSQLFDRRLRFNAALFLYEYKDIQVQAIPGLAIVTTNAASATIKGIDVDFEARFIRNLSISGGFAILDGQYNDYKTAVRFPASRLDGPPTPFDASGFDTIRTPKFTGSLAATYEIPTSVGRFAITGSGYHNSGFFYDANNEFRQNSYTLLNASINWRSADDRFGVNLWGRNLTKTYYYSGGVPSGFGSIYTPAAPRTYGATLSVHL